MQSIALDTLKMFMCVGPPDRKWVFDWFVATASSRQPGEVAPGDPLMPMKRCINNSIKALAVHNMQYSEKSGYMEGFVFVYIPILHAWNTVGGAWIDHTLWDAREREYFGAPIPIPLLLVAAKDDAWTSCTGVLQTIMLSRDPDLIDFAKELLV
jgi:hypothetical protein